ncbi:hypothetical protein H6P81_017449 [Aristolochia fimbriata]|uniref:Glycylpeptide N-tetradecanoyltransferase n=1 Tax=Aristolochia fimbriata TaxID=158543 RepID=A0AAV7E063_ARIFI|nr:hypothetical protein H6P81_017449 [Aristolochia fimbriata]
MASKTALASVFLFLALLGKVNGANSKKEKIHSKVRDEYGTGNQTISDFFHVYHFEEFFPERNSPAAHAVGFWDYHSFISAASVFEPLGFGITGGKLMQMKEVAAFLAHFGSQTSCGHTDAMGKRPTAWGLCYSAKADSIICDPNGLCRYCDPYSSYPCPNPPNDAHMKNEYEKSGEANLKVDLVNHPELLHPNATVAFQTGIWSWMNPIKKKQPTAHDVFVGNWKPTRVDILAKRVPGFGTTMNVLYGDRVPAQSVFRPKSDEKSAPGSIDMVGSSSPPSEDQTQENSSDVNENAPSGTDTSLETLARKVQESLSLGKKHTFWETQPVGQFKDIGDTTLPEGPIEPPTPLSEVKQEPYNLPNLYEWTTCDIDSEAVCGEIYNLLSNNYVEDDENMFRFNYSKEFLRWALRPPGYYRSWHIGVRAKVSKKLVAFISGIPARIRARDEVVKMAEINFLCVHKKLRSKRLAPVMIKEVTRRVHLENIWQAAYTAGVVLPTPIATCQYWHRSLNPKKLIDVGFSRLGARMTMSRTIKLYKLPESTATPGFRKMELRDIPAVTRLLRNYLSQFGVAPDFDEDDVEHWLLPKENVVDSYLVESPDSHEITDFCSFYTLPSTILGHQSYTLLKAAYSYYNVSTRTPLLQLMNDALIVAKQKDYDVFNALDVMQNESFLKELKFGPGDGQLHYYLYNYRVRQALKPSELGLVLL